MKLTIKDLKEKHLILLECISGSKAYNLDTANSDTDIRGVYYLPKNHFYGFDDQPQISNATNDVVYYEIGRFIELLLKNNPACLELLATPDEFVLYRSDLLNQLSYQDFMTEEVKDTFIGYALSQIKKAKGLNKKFLQPMDSKRKTVLDFCWIMEAEKSIPLLDWLVHHQYDQALCGLSKMAHSKELYALYYHPKHGYRGIIRNDSNDDIRLSTIPKHEKPIAYMLFQKEEYSVYCKKYKAYWDWMKIRNEERYTTNMNHGKNYDSKNMMHTIRLLKVVKELLETGQFNVYRSHDREELLAIKNGKYSYEEVLQQAEHLVEDIHHLKEITHYQFKRNDAQIEQFLIELRTKLYENN